MKHLFLTAAVLGSLGLSAQTHIYNSADYSNLKTAGNLPKGNVIELTAPLLDSTPDLTAIYNQKSGGGCGCYVDPDGTYVLAMAPNDDGSSALINLPFTFCLYGTNYTSLYINNNGNVSFGTPYGTFSASGFPSTSFVMVAPFWADVDTRPAGGGQVLYKIKPNAIYVNWVGVGYYSMQTDKLNTFQLVLSDGTDSLIGIGNNVGFCYKDMQWTTGSASSGVGGFGGTPANVGANKGDGINYIQFGRFDQPGTAYDGPVGANDGISWLDYQSFEYSTCVTTGNVAPVFIDFSPAIANISFDCGTGDTIKLCATGDTLVMSATILDPNVSDIVTMGVTSTSPVGFSVLSSTPGNPGTVTWQFVADPANYGMNVFTVTATDNGTPALSTTGTVVIFVDTTGTASFNTNILGDTLLCAGETTTLSVPAIFDTYDWSTGSATTSSGVVGVGEHFVTLSLNGCYKTITQDVIELPDPSPIVLGPLSICAGPTSLSTDPSYVSFNWNLNGSTISTTSTATASTAGTLILTVTDTNGCTGDSTYTIVGAPSVAITGPLTGCTGDTLDLLATPNTTGTILWSNLATTFTNSVTSSGTYIAVFTDAAGCTASDTVVVNLTITPNIFISTADSIVCVGDTITLSVGGTTGGGTISWSTGSSASSINVLSGTSVSLTVNNAGCTDSDNISILFNPNPTVTITGPTSACADTPITLTATGSTTGTYDWSTAETTSSIVPTSSGTYTVVFTDANGCTGTDNETVTIHPMPVASFTVSIPSPYVVTTGLPVTANITNTSTISSGSIVTNGWIINDTAMYAGVTSPTHPFAYYGNHEIILVVVSDQGCVDTAVQVIELIPDLVVPNIFTPSSTSGQNDFFVVKNLSYFAPSSLKIFNRWGIEVFSSADYKNNWDGTKKGNDVSDGVYYYELILNTGKIYTGPVHITRK